MNSEIGVWFDKSKYKCRGFKLYPLSWIKGNCLCLCFHKLNVSEIWMCSKQHQSFPLNCRIWMYLLCSHVSAPWCIFMLQYFTDHLLCTSLLRHRLPDFSGRSVLRALLHHDVAHYGWWQRLPPSTGRDLLFLALLCGLDCTSTAGLEQVWARGSWHHLLSWLEDPDSEQHLLHHLPVHFLPGPALWHHPLLLWQAPACRQTGGILQMLMLYMKVVQKWYNKPLGENIMPLLWSLSRSICSALQSRLEMASEIKCIFTWFSFTPNTCPWP